MDAKIIDWSWIPRGNEVALLGYLHSFKEITGAIVSGKTVGELIVSYDGNIGETGFREFLLGFVSVPWSPGGLTKEEVKALNAIREYLRPGHKQEGQPIVEGGVTLKELVARTKPKK